MVELNPHTVFKSLLKHRSCSETWEFLGFIMSNVKKSHSQVFQDLWVQFEYSKISLPNYNHGQFIEAGAMDGVTGSNTLLLEQFGWNGLLIEPNPNNNSSLTKNRSQHYINKCLWDKSDQKLKFLVTRLPELSTTEEHKHTTTMSRNSRDEVETIDVETISLNDVFKKYFDQTYNDIYLSLDTEGSELRILSTFDFKKYGPKFITVEHNFNSAKRSQLFDMMVSNGYTRKFETFSQMDDWYVRN